MSVLADVASNENPKRIPVLENCDDDQLAAAWVDLTDVQNSRVKLMQTDFTRYLESKELKSIPLPFFKTTVGFPCHLVEIGVVYNNKLLLMKKTIKTKVQSPSNVRYLFDV